MQKATDWLELWRELVDTHEASWRTGGARSREDVWLARAKKFDADVKHRWATPDSSRSFVTGLLKSNPGWTALDIGGGTGAWASLMARDASRVTVVEPSPAMVEVMRRNLEEAGVRNVEIVEEKWPDAQVQKHDLVLCAQAMYGFRDFGAFVRSVESAARQICVLIMRAPIPGDLMSIAAEQIWGQPFDSPDFQVAYNALLQMGIFPNVLMEDTGLWDPWVSETLEEAFAEAKRRLNLMENKEHDAYLRDLLAGRLTLRNGRYEWPRGILTALVYWNVNRD